MIKFSSNSDFDFGIESVHIVRDIKGLVKRASAKHLLKYEKTANQTDLHIIGVGAYEGTGFNRNLDMFKEADCAKNYSCFTRADRAVHRHHKNKKEDPKYGNIKAAAYNKPMRRIEMILGLDNDKCADIIQEQEKVGHTNWSMASKQAHDVCTWCGHKASTDEDRCEHIPDKLGEINDEGMMCGMENPDPQWFEMSYVKRPADRIGMSLSKCASATRVRPMLTSDYMNIYTGFQAPTDDDFLISKKASDKRNLLSKLSELEKHLDAVGKPAITSAKLIKTDKIAADVLDDLRKLEPARFFKLAADKGIILSPENFATYLFGGRVKTAAISGMKCHLPHIFTELEKSGGDVLNSEKYEPAQLVLSSRDDRSLINKIAASHSLFETMLQARTVYSVLNKEAEVSTNESTDPFDKELARQYASYKLAALNYLNENDKLDTNLMYAVVTQNRN